jgi:hypothetical protein
MANRKAALFYILLGLIIALAITGMLTRISSQ